MTKKFFFCLDGGSVVTTFELVVVGWIPNLESGKICRIDSLFAKLILKNEVVNFGEKWLIWAIISCINYGEKYTVVPRNSGLQNSGLPLSSGQFLGDQLFVSFLCSNSPLVVDSLSSGHFLGKRLSDFSNNCSFFAAFFSFTLSSF